jgi:DNA-binding NtrC family response regulator
MRKKEAGILIVDDDEDILFSARVWLKKFFTEVITINSPNKIITALQNHQIDVILLDMNFRRGFEDGKEGLYWLSEIKEIDKDVPVILMTAYGEVELAVEALKMVQPILF